MKALILTIALCAGSVMAHANNNQCEPSGRKSHDPVHNGGRSSFELECKSTDSCFKRCLVEDIISDAYLIEETSDGKCVEGITWGRELSSVWVDEGCEARFEIFNYR